MIITPPNSGKDLPELSNPAGSSDLLSGKQMINRLSGAKVRFWLCNIVK